MQPVAGCGAGASPGQHSPLSACLKAAVHAGKVGPFSSTCTNLHCNFRYYLPSAEEMEIPDRLASPAHLMFSHTRLDHKRNSIRLIRVLPKLSDTLLIRCEVVHVVLPPASKYDIDYEEEEAYEPAILPLASENDAECPPYVCLSYTWGDPVDEPAIEINGKVLKVRENLWTFLNVARKQFTDIHLWIDALCKSHFTLNRKGSVR
jgi:hypothetical protein